MPGRGRATVLATRTSGRKVMLPGPANDCKSRETREVTATRMPRSPLAGAPAPEGEASLALFHRRVGPHHLVVLVVEDVAVPDVARAQGRVEGELVLPRLDGVDGRLGR